MVYPVHRSQAFVVLTVLLWCVGSLVVAVWFHISGVRADVENWREWLSAMALVASAIGAASLLRTSDQDHLVRNGEVWLDDGLMRAKPGWRNLDLASAEVLKTAELEVRIVVNMQLTMLLQLLRGPHTCRWVWVERSAQPERWLDLRRAVHSRRRLTQPGVGAVRADLTPEADSL